MAATPQEIKKYEAKGREQVDEGLPGCFGCPLSAAHAPGLVASNALPVPQRRPVPDAICETAC